MLKQWIKNVKDIFFGKEYQELKPPENPLESNEDIATDAKISIRNLKKTSMNGNNVAKAMDRLS